MTTKTDLPDFLKTGTEAGSPGRSKRRWTIASAVVIVIAGGLFFASRSGTPPLHYRTEDASTGKLVVSISASGSLTPTRSVDVGSELSGTIESILVEENEQVSKGQIIARLEPSKLQDSVTKSRAAVAVAEATVAQMEATVAESRASLARQRQVAELSGGKVPSKTELDAAEADYQRAMANLASAKATVVQTQATLKSDETNISKAVIRAPINGVVLSRKVEPGQTVAASMTTPVLFTIAEDLTKMQLQVKVDEADVGSVKLGQPATFTVSSWAGRDFPAVIQRVGIGSTTTDNVVTYKTVLDVQNDDLALRPGMTATARIITAQRDQALLVANAALRFSPTTGAAESSSRSILAKLMPRPSREPRKSTASKTQAPGAAKVWVLLDGHPVSVEVTTGLSNGRQTEITGGDLKAGMAVITDYQEAKS